MIEETQQQQETPASKKEPRLIILDSSFKDQIRE